MGRLAHRNKFKCHRDHRQNAMINTEKKVEIHEMKEKINSNLFKLSFQVVRQSITLYCLAQERI